MRHLLGHFLFVCVLINKSLAQCATPPPAMNLPQDWKMISVGIGEQYVFAIKTDGTLWQWGYEFTLPNAPMRRTLVPKLLDNGLWKTVSAGYQHVAAIKNDGTLWTVGANDQGSLGDGTTLMKIDLAQVGNSSDWAQVDAGKGFTIALKTDGTLWAWGANDAGQLGDGTITSSFVPKQIGSASDWVSISCGIAHTLAMKSDGTLWAWGDNKVGEVGNGTTLPVTTPVRIGNDNTWKTISANWNNSSAVKIDGTLWSWGYNEVDSGNLYPSTPQQLGADHDWSFISYGALHVLALKNDGTLWARGSNQMGQFGNGTVTTPFVNDFLQVGNQTDWVYVVARNGFSFGQKKDGTVWSWGDYDAPLGTVNPPSMISSPKVVNTPAVVSLQGSCSAATVSNLTVSGTSVQWYDVPQGGNALPTSTALVSGSHYYASQTIAGCESTDRLDVLVTNAGMTAAPAYLSPTVYCYGATLAALPVIGNSLKWYDASLGGSVLSNSILLEPGKHYFVSQTISGCESARLDVAPDVQHTLPPAGDANQTVCEGTVINQLTAQGDNITWYYQPGGSPIPDPSIDLVDGKHYYATQTQQNCESTPLDIHVKVIVTPPPTGKTDYSFCSYFTIDSLTVTGQEIAWYFSRPDKIESGGKIDYSTFLKATQTVNGCESQESLLVKINVVTNKVLAPTYSVPNTWKQIAAGARHAVGIKTDGTLWAWGDNAYGQLGNGTTNHERYPIQIGTDRDWKKVVPSRSQSTFVLKENGTLWACGLNEFGQLGDGTLSDRSTLSQVGNDADWQEVSFEYGHVLALKKEGTLWAWGNNEFGELGDSTYTNRLVPTQIGTKNTWSAISAGLKHSLALQKDGTLWAWGDDAYNQLGDNDPSFAKKNKPVQISINNDWSVIDASAFTSYAIKKNGTLWGWGGNIWGELGDKSKSGAKPIQIGADTNWKKIAGDGENGFHNFAIKTNGTLWGWGYQQRDIAVGNLVGGQLGDGGNSSDYQSIKQIGTSTNWQSVTIGDFFSLAIDNGGGLWFWGSSYYGYSERQILSSSSVPVIVPSAQAHISQTFCPAATVADLKATGSAIKWYTAADSLKPLPPTTPLKNGAYYYATQKVGLCESIPRLEMLVFEKNLNVTAPNASDQDLCSGASVKDLKASGSDILWYSTQSGGTPLPESTLLSSSSYYATQTKEQCESTDRTKIAVAVYPIPEAPLGSSEQNFTEGKTIADLTITGENIKWYPYGSHTTPLNPGRLLQNDSSYFASQTKFGCESNGYLKVHVSLITAIDDHSKTVAYYPNPTTGQLKITTHSSLTKITIFSMLGEILYSYETSNQEIDLNIKDFSAGVYLVQVDTNDGVSKFKIVKE
ncbi:MAG: T9SS type A sorting domain-containing protein [Bacteroidetes bacterium]|nr:T9SS type A sorting domain-containing protein [Bacteroidota bacterium]